MRGIIATIVAALFGFFGYFWGFFFRQRNKQNVQVNNGEQKGLPVSPPKNINVVPEKKKDDSNNIIKEEKKIQEQIVKKEQSIVEKPKAEEEVMKSPEKPKQPSASVPLRSENKLLFVSSKPKT